MTTPSTLQAIARQAAETLLPAGLAKDGLVCNTYARVIEQAILDSNKGLVETLRSVEWIVDMPESSSDAVCPWCGVEKGQNHESICLVAAALAPYERDKTDAV